MIESTAVHIICFLAHDPNNPPDGDVSEDELEYEWICATPKYQFYTVKCSQQDLSILSLKGATYIVTAENNKQKDKVTTAMLHGVVAWPGAELDFDAIRNLCYNKDLEL